MSIYYVIIIYIYIFYIKYFIFDIILATECNNKYALIYIHYNFSRTETMSLTPDTSNIIREQVYLVRSSAPSY